MGCSVGYVVGNVLFSLVSLFREEWRVAAMLLARFITGAASGKTIANVMFLYIYVWIIAKKANLNYSKEINQEKSFNLVNVNYFS